MEAQGKREFNVIQLRNLLRKPETWTTWAASLIVYST